MFTRTVGMVVAMEGIYSATYLPWQALVPPQQTSKGLGEWSRGAIHHVPGGSHTCPPDNAAAPLATTAETYFVASRHDGYHGRLMAFSADPDRRCEMQEQTAFDINLGFR